MQTIARHLSYANYCAIKPILENARNQHLVVSFTYPNHGHSIHGFAERWGVITAIYQGPNGPYITVENPIEARNFTLNKVRDLKVHNFLKGTIEDVVFSATA